MLKCPTCGGMFEQGVKIRKTPCARRPSIIEFDAYECYLKFWADVPNFEPLLEWRK